MFPVSKLFLLVFILWSSEAFAKDSYPPPCDSKIYCVGGPGTLLHTVQMARLYNDSKTFVDKPMTASKWAVERNFREFISMYPNPTKDQVQVFVDDNFSQEGTEFEAWAPPDWTDNPKFLEKIKDDKYRAFARDIHGRWRDLGRKIRRDLQSSRTSMIFLDKPFIVPGGRFRECYYWDSYWTILGLLKSEMNQTVTGMLENFSYLVSTIGFIPNGNRIYYNKRSQPPLFISMVDAYYKATKNNYFVESNLQMMETEFNFWMRNRMRKFKTADGSEHTMAVYNVMVDGPRPESYREDYNMGQLFPVDNNRLEFYMNIKSGAESGWDFSSKWLIDPVTGDDSDDLTHIQTRHIVPVELNSYLCKNAKILAQFFKGSENEAKAREYEKKALEIQNSIDQVLWNDEEGAWFDYDIGNKKQRKYFYPSTVAPLWADCYPKVKNNRIPKFLDYLRSQEAFHSGGVPTSKVETGQQWDFPNGWPPLQEMMITGLDNTGDPEASEMALELARRWIMNNYVAYNQSGSKIFEKYNVEQIGLPGGAGEYDVQEGFGWTNGVLLSLLDKYGDRVFSNDTVSGGRGIRPEWFLVFGAAAWTSMLVMYFQQRRFC